MFNTLLFFILLAMTHSIAGANFSCPTQTPDPKLKLASLPDKFKVSLQFVNMLANFSADFIEFDEKSKDLHITVLKCENGTQSFDTIYDRMGKTLTFINKTGISKSCQVTAYELGPPHKDFFFFPYNIVKLDQPILGISDFMKFLEKSSLSADIDNHDHDHGIAVDHITACSKSPDGKFWLEFKICVLKDGFLLNDLNVSKLKLPTRLDLTIYDFKPAKDAKPLFNAIYEIFGYQTNFDAVDDNFNLPPKGLFCTGRNTSSKPVPKLPDTFSLSIENVDHENKHTDASQLYYDTKDGVITIDFTRSNDFEPFTIGILDKLPFGPYLAVQDFKSGLQYVIEPISHRCVNAGPIPGNVGTRKLAGKDKRLLSMKSAFEVLFTANESQYFYVGERMDDGVPLEVWNVFYGKEPAQEFVQEIWFSMKNWQNKASGTNLSSVPVLLKIYPKDSQVPSMVQKFYNFVAYDKEQSKARLLKYNVFECREKFGNYMIELNATLEHIKTFGIDNVANQLREFISNQSGVSQFRLGQFTMLPDDERKSVNVSFAIAKVFGQRGTSTDIFRDEIDPKEIVENLNKSLTNDHFNFQVKVAGKILILASVKGSCLLAADPLAVNARISPIYKKGYSGGSMFTMAIFMLMIGGIGGGMLAVVYFKRNRGGVAYQIYE